MQALFLIRGLPGSGKTTAARSIKELSDNKPWIIAADDWFRIFNRNQFEADKLPDAHEWCQTTTQRQLALGRTVIVHNTFTQQWEMQPYIDLADMMEIQCIILTANNHHNSKSVHDVPEATVEKMKQRWFDF